MQNEKCKIGRGVKRAPARFLFLLIFNFAFFILNCPPLFAQPLPWHAAGWSQRVIVKVDNAGGAGVDVAAVRVTHAGQAATNGNDFRVFDSSGQPVPYEVTFHDPARDSLISFRCPPNLAPGGVFAIYFGKPDAPADALRATPSAPGGGAPQPGPSAGGWIPKAGLVLTTMRRVDENAAKNPETPAEMFKLITSSPGLDGASYRGNISDGFNPHGDSEYYVSVYRGWINIPAAGKYGFCTASNEASFSFMDGQELVHWPGMHVETRGKYGEKNVERDFAAGLHYVEYFHEEVKLYQVAFLGYKPPGAKAYIAIPDSMYPQPHRASVQTYEGADGKRLVSPKLELVDSRWPPGRAQGQQTRYKLSVDGGAEKFDASKWTVSWTFGDGETASGAAGAVEHVYLTLGKHTVTMSATGPEGQKVERTWPLTVFQIDHVAGAFKNGQIGNYLPIVKGYDPAKLATPALVELARLFNEASDNEATKKTATLASSRGDLTPEDSADMHLLIATSSALGKTGVGGSSTSLAAAKEVAAHLQTAIEKEKDPVERVQAMARFIRALGIDQGDVQAAEQVYAKAELEARASNLGRKMKQAFREATIAIGDAHLFARQVDKANEDYKTAEALSESPMPPQVKASKVGAFPEAIEQHLEANRIDQAMIIAQRWRNEVPSDQVRGAVLYYIGKLERLQGRPAAAIRPLTLAIDLAQGAEFEAEARYLLAQAYKDTGDAEAGERTLRGLVKSGLGGPFRAKAVEELKK